MDRHLRKYHLSYKCQIVQGYYLPEYDFFRSYNILGVHYASMPREVEAGSFCRRKAIVGWREVRLRKMRRLMKPLARMSEQ